MLTLVTGAGGFLGAHVCAELRARGEPVRALVRPGRPTTHLVELGVELAEGDVRDDASLRRACRGVRRVVHCAGVRSSWRKRAEEQRQVNVEGTARLVRAARDHEVERFVHVSTCSTLGANRTGELRDERSECNLRGLGIGYVDTKYEAEERMRSAAWTGFPVVIVNPVWLVGPRRDGRAPTIAAQLENGLARVPSGGIAAGDVEDAARGIVAALEKGRVGERYVLAGHNLPQVEVYAAVARAMGLERTVRALPRAWSFAAERVLTLADLVRLARPPHTPDVYRAHGLFAFHDGRKAREELGFVARPFEETCARIADAWCAARAN
ncbi:MAG: NAD-dependent epimerase/dehydratase family protein [Planctomycetota bacterium]